MHCKFIYLIDPCIISYPAVTQHTKHIWDHLLHLFSKHALTIIPHMVVKFNCIHTWPTGKDHSTCSIQIMRTHVVTSTANLRIKNTYLLVVYLMKLSAAQTRQWRTVGLVIMNLTWWSDSGLHEAWTGHLLNTRQKCYHFSQRSVNRKQSASLSAGRILTNNRHKRVKFSKNSQICRCKLSLQPPPY